MTLVLPQPPQRYAREYESTRNRTLELEDLLNHKRYQDIVLDGTTLYIKSPSGILYPIVVDDDGNVGTDRGTVAYGAIYTVDNQTNSQTIGTTAEKLTGFDENGAIFYAVTQDAANDRIVLDTAGVYEATFGITFTGSNNTDFGFAFAVDGQLASVRIQGATGSQGDLNSVALSTLVASAEGTVLEVWAVSQASNRTLEAIDMHMMCSLVATKKSVSLGIMGNDEGTIHMLDDFV